MHIFLLIGLLLQANFVTADIYRSQDAKGHIQFSDQPVPHAVKIQVKRQPYRYQFRVKYVYDGDTIVLSNGQRVRLLGINTPEIESRFRRGEAGGVDAKKWLKNKLKDGVVLLEYGHPDRDKYGRLLAYLFLPDGTHLNLELVRQGLAVLSIIPPNLKYDKALIRAQQQAERQKIGLWERPEYQPVLLDTLLKQKKRRGWMRIIATVKSVSHSRKYARLILNHKADVRIPKENLTWFPDLDSYIGQTVEIRGWPSRSKGHVSILVRHPSALELKADAALPVSDGSFQPPQKE